MLVEIGRADRQPAVVHDPDLRVYVDAAGGLRPGLVKRAGEEPIATLVGVDQHAELPASVLAAVVRACWEHDDKAELVAGRCLELASEDLDDLG